MRLGPVRPEFVDWTATGALTGSLNSVARGLAVGLGVHRCEERARLVAVPADACCQGIETVVSEFVVQFVQQFHADDFTVCTFRAQAFRPLQAVGLQKYTAAIDVVWAQRGADAQVGNALQRIGA